MSFNPFHRGATLRVPLELVGRVNVERRGNLNETQIQNLNRDICALFDRYRLRIPNLNQGLSYNIFPQLVGQHEIADIVQENVRFPVSKLVDMKRVASLQDIKELFNRLYNLYNMLEGRSFSDNDRTNVEEAEVIFSQRPDYAARPVLAYNDDVPDGKLKFFIHNLFGQRPHNKRFILETRKNPNIFEAGACGAHAVLFGLSILFPDLQISSNHYHRINDWCHERKGTTPFMLSQMMSDLSWFGPFAIYKGDMRKLFRICVLQEGKLMKSDVEYEKDTRGRTLHKDDEMMIQVGKREKNMQVYLVQAANHWYVYFSDKQDLWYKGWAVKRISNPSTCHYDMNKEEPLRQVNTDQQKHIDDNVKMENTIFKRLKSGRSVLCCGPGGSGKTVMLENLYHRFQGKMVYTSWIANLARENPNMKGETLHSLFCGFKKMWVDNRQMALYKGDDMEVLAIDEVGNNHWQWFEYMDNALQNFKGNDRPFGGVTLLLMGDFMQLRPILESNPDYVFYHPIVKKIVMTGGYFECDTPLRYLEKMNEETIDFVQALDRVRYGKDTPWLKQKFKDSHITNEDQYFKHYDECSIEELPLFMTTTKAMCRKIHNRYIHATTSIKFTQEELKVIRKNLSCGDKKSEHPSKMAQPNINMSIGAPYMISHNQVQIWQGEEEYDCSSTTNNGTKVIFKGINDKGLVFYQPNIKGEIVLAPLMWEMKGLLVYQWAIKPWIARTIDGVQGRTEPRISLYLPRGKSLMKEHSLYVVISRAISLMDFKWYGPKKLKLEELIAVDLDCIQFQKDPYLITDPRVKGVSRGIRPAQKKVLWNTDESRTELSRYKVKELLWAKSGLLKDTFYSQNNRLFDHAFFLDNETMIKASSGQDRILEAYGIATQYYIEGVIEKPLVESGYIWREDHQQAYFTKEKRNEQNGSAEENICWSIMRLIERVGTEHVSGNTIKPLTVMGFNLHNFDMLMLLKHIIETKYNQEYVVEITKTTGTQNKGMRVVKLWWDEEQEKVRKRTVMKTHDIMHVMGIGSLDAHCKSWLMNLYKENIDVFIQATATKMEQCIFQGEELQSFLSRGKNEMEKDVFTPKKGREMSAMERYTRAKNLYKHMQDNRDRLYNPEIVYKRKLKKGSAPLKLMNEYSTDEKFQWLCSNKINLKEILEQPGGWERCFHDGRVDHARQHFKDLDRFTEYDLLKEIQDYAMDDINVTVLLYRIMNNICYEFAKEHPRFQQPSGHGGVRLSVLEFLTTCQLTGYLSVKFMDESMLEYDKYKRKITVDQPLYDERMYKLLRQMSAGKVLPRCWNWRGDKQDETDYCVYLDISGMYASAMRDFEYPYGGIKHVYRSPQDDEILNKMRDDLNAKKFGKVCWAAMVTRRLNPKELDPPVGTKKPADGKKYTDQTNRLEYCNDPWGTLETHISCQDIVEAGGTIDKIHYAIFWEKQGKILEPYMSYLAIGKASNSGAKKSFFKLMQNAEYGNMGKKNYDSATYMVPKKAMEDFMEAVSLGDFDGTATQSSNKTYIFNLSKRDFGLSSRPTHMSSFVLAYSHHMMNRAIQVMFGEDRHNIEKAIQYVSKYGDTDSIVVPKKAMDRLVEYDKNHPDEPNFLIYQDTGKMDKMGKFADELADGLWDEYEQAKETHQPHEMDGMDASFPDFESGFVCRVIEMWCPQPKTYCCKYIYPPGTYNGMATTKDNFKSIPLSAWHTKFKVKCKGISKGAELKPDDDSLLTAKMGNNEKAFEIMKYCLEKGICMNTIKRDGIGKFLDRVPENKKRRMEFTNYSREMPRKIFNAKSGCRKEEVYKQKIIQVPPGFDWEPYSHEQIQKALYRTQCPQCNPEDAYCCMFKQFT